MVGEIMATTVSQGLEADTHSLFATIGNSYGESELRCDYTKYAKLAE